MSETTSPGMKALNAAIAAHPELKSEAQHVFLNMMQTMHQMGTDTKENADMAAGKLAQAMQPEKLVYHHISVGQSDSEVTLHTLDYVTPSKAHEPAVEMGR